MSSFDKVVSSWKPSNPTMLPCAAHPHMHTTELVLMGIQIWDFKLEIILLGRNEPLCKNYTVCFFFKMHLLEYFSHWNFTMNLDSLNPCIFHHWGLGEDITRYLLDMHDIFLSTDTTRDGREQSFTRLEARTWIQ